MDYYSKDFQSSLSKSLETSYRAMQPFRRLNAALVDDYVGSGYGSDNRPRRETVLNLLHQAVEAYVIELASNRPRVLVTTEHAEMVPFAKKYEVACNNLIKEIGLEHTLRRWVLDAFFSVGIIKVHQADAGQVQIEADLWADPGTPFASNLSLDDFVFDSTARKFESVRFAGDMYRLPYVDFEESGMFDPDEVKKHTSANNSDNDEERLEYLSGGNEHDQDPFEPMIDLVDVWFPRSDEIATYVIKSRHNCTISGNPVGVMLWGGPEFGPYHLLGFTDVPENVLPVSPAAQLQFLHRQINNLMRKQSKRARNHKIHPIFNPAGAKDAEKAQKYGDGHWIAVESVQDIGRLDTGGVDSGDQMFTNELMEHFDRAGGNLSSILGLGPSAGTVGQEKMIQGASSKKLSGMKQQFNGGAVRVMRDLGYLLWKDEFKIIKGNLPIPEAEGYALDMTWKPDDRLGDFYEYNFDIDLFSTDYQTPAGRIEAINTIMTSIYAPFAEMIMQQGGIIDFQKLNEMYADMLGLPRLREVMRWTNPQPSDRPGAQDSLRMPASTTRTYQRQNIPTGGTQESQALQRREQWSNMQPSGMG